MVNRTVGKILDLDEKKLFKMKKMVDNGTFLTYSIYLMIFEEEKK